MAKYIFYKQKLIDNINMLKDAYKSKGINFKIYYSVKTNPSDCVLEIINNENCNFEVVSYDEWLSVKKYNPTTLVLNGPSKDIKILKNIFDCNVKELYFNIDNDTDFDIIDSIDNIYTDKLKLGVRVYLDKTGIWNRFGFDIDSPRLVQIIKKYRDKINGFHFHFSTNNFNFENYLQIMTKINNLIDKYQLNLEYIDIGGGFPGASEEMYSNIIYNKLPDLIKTMMPDNITIISEVGRNLIEDTFNMKTSVISKKKISEDKFDIVIDTNILHFPCYWEKKFGIDYIVKNANKDQKPININIFGNSCMQIDKIADNFLIACEPNINDNVIISKIGAYSVSQASNFITKIPNIVIS